MGSRTWPSIHGCHQGAPTTSLDLSRLAPEFLVLSIHPSLFAREFIWNG